MLLMEGQTARGPKRVAMHVFSTRDQNYFVSAVAAGKYDVPDSLCLGFVNASTASDREESVVDGEARCKEGAQVRVSVEYENNAEWPQLREFYGREGK